MKHHLILSLSVAIIVAFPNAHAALIFAESLGTVSATTTISAHESANGFDNDSFTYSGTGDLRNSTPSSGYTGSSAVANAFLTNNSTRTFIIDGISTVGYTAGSIGITFGAHKSTTASNMSTLLLDYSTNGTSWSSITVPTQATGSGTAVWRLVSIPTTAIPISATLALRWTNSDATAQYRIDDISLTGVPEPAAALIGSIGLLGLLRRRRSL